MNHLALTDWCICLGYIAMVLGLGFYFSNKQKGNDDFFFGGRQMHWIPVGLSLFATTFSSNSFVGLPAEAAYRDWHQLLAIYFIPFVVVPITCIWFIPFYKGLGFRSLYEYLERRFTRPVRLMASLIFMVYSAGWMGTMLLAVSRILNVVLDSQSSGQTIVIIGITGLLATLYTAMGGVKAVIWTDAIQAFALFGGMVFLLALLLVKIDGGWETFLATGAQDDKFTMFRTDGGFGERNLYSACAYGFFVYMGGQVASYGAFQRYVSVDSVREAQQALAIKGVFAFVSSTLFFLVGSALYVYYQQSHPEVFTELSVGRSKDQLLPHFVIHYAGGYGMVGLVLAGLFAAAMSSLDSGINSMTATLVTDWLRGREVGTLTNRCLTVGFGAGVTLIGCLLALINSPVFDILMSISGATLGLLLAVLIMGMFLPRVNTFGVVVGLVAGLAVFLAIRVGIPSLEPETLERLGPLGGIEAKYLVGWHIRHGTGNRDGDAGKLPGSSAARPAIVGTAVAPVTTPPPTPPRRLAELGKHAGRGERLGIASSCG